MTYPVGPGHKQTVSERGWFTEDTGMTACRFAILTQIAIRTGYSVPLARQPKGADNFVYDLQLAGDNTPHNGSTMRQGQKGVAALLPGAPISFGTMTDAEMFEAVKRGATVGFAVNCGKLPRYLRNFVGYSYTKGHYVAVDGVDGNMVDLSDPMYRPARDAKPRRVDWADLSPAVLRDRQGALIVSLGYQDEAYLQQQLVKAQERLTDAHVLTIDAQGDIDALNGKISALHGTGEAP
jgi:hypothetical protein